MTSKTILFLAIAAVLITGTLSVNQTAFAQEDNKKDKDKDNKETKKVLVKSRDSNDDPVNATCLVEWRGGDSGPINTNNGGVAETGVPSDADQVKVTCGDGETRSSTTAELKDKGTTPITILFEAELEPDPFEEIWKAIDRIANALRGLQDKDMELMEKDDQISERVDELIPVVNQLASNQKQLLEVTTQIIPAVNEATTDIDLLTGTVIDLQTQIDDIGTGSQGPPGEDGTSCTVEDTADGAKIVCEDGTMEEIFDGEQGPPSPIVPLPPLPVPVIEGFAQCFPDTVLTGIVSEQTPSGSVITEILCSPLIALP